MLGLVWLEIGAASQSGSGRPTVNSSTRGRELILLLFRRNIFVTLAGRLVVGGGGGLHQGGEDGEQKSHPLIIAFLPPPIWRLPVAAL